MIEVKTAVLIVVVVILIGWLSLGLGGWAYGSSNGLGVGGMASAHFNPSGEPFVVSEDMTTMGKIKRWAKRAEPFGVYDTGGGQRSTPSYGAGATIMGYEEAKFQGARLPSISRPLA